MVSFDFEDGFILLYVLLAAAMASNKITDERSTVSSAKVSCCGRFWAKLTRRKVIREDLMKTELDRILTPLAVVMIGIGQMSGGGAFVVLGEFRAALEYIRKLTRFSTFRACSTARRSWSGTVVRDWWNSCVYHRHLLRRIRRHNTTSRFWILI